MWDLPEESLARMSAQAYVSEHYPTMALRPEWKTGLDVARSLAIEAYEDLYKGCYGHRPRSVDFQTWSLSTLRTQMMLMDRLDEDERDDDDGQIFATQGGGRARGCGDRFVFVDPPDWGGYKPGDLVPEEWGVVMIGKE